MAAKKETGDNLVVIISPSDMKEYKESYAVSGIKKLPFGQKVTITQHDLKQLRQQRVPIIIDKNINVRQIMDEMRVSQEKANKVAREMQSDPSMNKSYRYVPKYHVEIV